MSHCFGNTFAHQLHFEFLKIHSSQSGMCAQTKIVWMTDTPFEQNEIFSFNCFFLFCEPRAITIWHILSAYCTTKNIFGSTTKSVNVFVDVKIMASGKSWEKMGLLWAPLVTHENFTMQKCLNVHWHWRLIIYCDFVSRFRLDKWTRSGKHCEACGQAYNLFWTLTGLGKFVKIPTWANNAC